ncbi:hypothetical protein CWC48_26865 [Pseudomonas sp. S10E 269]|uniref:putative phage abortive infection protein n=1 Tax=unclassified Pseudomonas TaxID=196821 RepID=UPI000C25C188|nr:MULTISPECIES: putative phage abortive infection protein [unclassified Pseudomonas]PJK33107.1 hypothetical protein CWC49_07305 [Pseudomonas sp. S09F 262]PJK42600.1 hypothetical protein CWC48_26865 [Pseudomonas sp. S10E 269]
MGKSKKNRDDVAFISLAVAALVLIIFVLIVVLSKTLASYDMPFLVTRSEEGLDRLGQIGDFFGGILNPLLSFIAFVAVVVSFRAQARNSKLAEESSNALSANQASQLEQLVKQGLIAERQSFENVFFGLLQIHSKNVQGFTFSVGGYSEVGQSAFSAVEARYNFNKLLSVPVNQAQWPGVVSNNIELFSVHINPLLGHFFNTASQILTYVETADNLSDLEKNRYVKIYTSTMSRAEMECLFLCLMSSYTLEKLRLFNGVSFFAGHSADDMLKEMKRRQFFGMSDLT